MNRPELEPTEVQILRGNTVEIVHEVSWAISQGGSIVESRGDLLRPVPLRSCGKPFQVAALLDAGGLNEVRSDSESVALLASSHNGEEPHVELILRLLASVGLNEQDLQCGTHEPYRSWVARRPASTNCSGKHVAMLLSTKYFGWDTTSYTMSTHPIQELIRRRIPEWTGSPLEEALDGCGVPTMVTRLSDLASAYADLAAGSSPGLATIRDAYMSSPFFLGGTGRHETYLNPKYHVAVKPGSDGLWAAAVPSTGLGIAVKCHSGDENAAAIVGVTLLERAGAFDLSGDEEIRRLLTWQVDTNEGKLAGRIEIS